MRRVRNAAGQTRELITVSILSIVCIASFFLIQDFTIHHADKVMVGRDFEINGALLGSQDENDIWNYAVLNREKSAERGALCVKKSEPIKLCVVDLNERNHPRVSAEERDKGVRVHVVGASKTLSSVPLVKVKVLSGRHEGSQWWVEAKDLIAVTKSTLL